MGSFNPQRRLDGTNHSSGSLPWAPKSVWNMVGLPENHKPPLVYAKTAKTHFLAFWTILTHFWAILMGLGAVLPPSAVYMVLTIVREVSPEHQRVFETWWGYQKIINRTWFTQKPLKQHFLAFLQIFTHFWAILMGLWAVLTHSAV